MKKIVLGFVFAFLTGQLIGQEVRLVNPSFEGFPQTSKMPRGWFNCGNLSESPPDIQPGSWDVTLSAQEGNTYLGMVTRSRETWECVYQRLSTPILAGTCYKFTIFLRRSNKYLSAEEFYSGAPLVNFTKPIKLRIWAGNGPNDKAQLLGESDVVSETDWVKYGFKLQPKQDFDYFFLEAYYQTPTLFPYNGNILLDNASALIPMKCEDDVQEQTIDEEPFVSFMSPHTKSKTKSNRILVKVRTKNVKRNSDLELYVNDKPIPDIYFKPQTQTGQIYVDLDHGINKLRVEVRNDFGDDFDEVVVLYGIPEREDIVARVEEVKKNPERTQPNPVEPNNSKTNEVVAKENTSIEGNNSIDKAKKGDIIVVENLFFEADKSTINPTSYGALNNLAQNLKENPDVKIEIGGHTNGRPTSHQWCDKLSEERAKEVYLYLVSKGVAKSQLAFKGYGKRLPIATNDTEEGRKKNQRVEIKVLEKGG